MNWILKGYKNTIWLSQGVKNADVFTFSLYARAIRCRGYFYKALEYDYKALESHLSMIIINIMSVKLSIFND